MKTFFDIDRFKEILDTLSRNRSRTLLTGFGIFWGVFMLLALTGGSQGLKDLLLNNFKGFASNSGFYIPTQTSRPYKGFQRGREWKMDLSDIDAIKAQVPGVDAVAPVGMRWGAVAVYGDRTYDGNFKGITMDYYSIETPKIKFGRPLNQMDMEDERKVCVLGKRPWEELFPGGEDPCGEFVKVGGVFYQVVGVDFSESSISVGAPPDWTITTPLKVFNKLYGKGDEVEFFGFTAKEGWRVKTLFKEVNDILARRHYFDPADDVASVTVNSESIFTMMDNLLKGVDIMILLIGLGTLLAGAIGVSNIMMVTVKERTSEIGIRRAIGATPKMILSQIIKESIVLTLTAGALGIMFTVLILSGAELAATKDGVLTAAFQIKFWTAIGAVAVLTVLGVLAGLAPAMRAMSIKPVDAMRDE
ncbi:MAG: ABC transporter permease [Bacteroidales bacterium]|nr:ABC transporter permease [Bacteroidales bacterium]